MIEKQSELYIINIVPRQADRARVSPKTGTFYNTPEYDRYKKQLILLFKGRTILLEGLKIVGKEIPKKDYYGIEAIFYFPYPKSTPKYKQIDGDRKRTKPDVDNIGKGIQDALEQAKTVVNDSLFSDINYKKKYTLGTPRIEFKLEYYEDL